MAGPELLHSLTTTGRSLFKRLKSGFSFSEAAPLLFLALMGIGIWLFVEIADEVMEQKTIDFDRQVLLSMRQPDRSEIPVGPPWLVSVARDITALGSYTVLIMLCVLVTAYFGLSHRFASMQLTLFCLIGGMAAISLLKLAFARERPDIPHLVEVTTKSFPSGHAMMSAVVYLTLGALLAQSQASKRLKIFFLAAAVLLSLLVGVSRIYLGVHYPTDVLAGWIAGSVWAMLCLLATVRIRRRPHQDSPSD